VAEKFALLEAQRELSGHNSVQSTATRMVMTFQRGSLTTRQTVPAVALNERLAYDLQTVVRRDVWIGRSLALVNAGGGPANPEIKCVLSE
jgi:hypothetical protein